VESGFLPSRFFSQLCCVRPLVSLRRQLLSAFPSSVTFYDVSSLHPPDFLPPPSSFQPGKATYVFRSPVVFPMFSRCLTSSKLRILGRLLIINILLPLPISFFSSLRFCFLRSRSALPDFKRDPGLQFLFPWARVQAPLPLRKKRPIASVRDSRSFGFFHPPWVEDSFF